MTNMVELNFTVLQLETMNYKKNFDKLKSSSFASAIRRTQSQNKYKLLKVNNFYRIKL